MARHRSTAASAASLLYWLARRARDVRAVQRGPKAIATRLANKAIGRFVVSKLWIRSK